MSTAIKHHDDHVPHWVKPLRAERQSAQISKITNDGLTQSDTGCFMDVPI